MGRAVRQLLPLFWRQPKVTTTCRGATTGTARTPTAMAMGTKARSGSQGQHLNNNSSDGNRISSDDVNEQETKILRVLEGAKRKENENNDQTKQGKKKDHTSVTRRRPNDQKKNNTNNHHSNYRRKTNRNYTKTKKLTLDEFFANLESTGKPSKPTAPIKESDHDAQKQRQQIGRAHV